MRVLLACIDAVNESDLNLLRDIYEDNYHGELRAIGIGHTVSSALAIITGRVPYFHGKPVGDWFVDNELLNYELFGDNVVGRSGLGEVWFHYPLLYPPPRRRNTVIVSGPPHVNLGYYTQPPWLEEELMQMGYIPDVPPDPNFTLSIDFLVNMERKRGEAVRRVLSEFDWGIGVTWWTGLDRLHHDREQYVRAEDTPYNRSLIITAIEREILRTIDELHPDYTIIFGDHGWSDEVKYHAPRTIYMIYPMKGRGGVASVVDLMPTAYKLLGLPNPFGKESIDLGRPYLVPRPLMDRRSDYISIGEKSEDSLAIIREAIKRYGDVAFAWSGGKDSSVAMYLTQLVKPDVRGIFVDTGAHFRETKTVTTVWGMLYKSNIITVKPSVKYINFAVDKTDCCFNNKVKPQHDAIRDLGVKALITGIRRSDGGGREGAKPFEERVTYHGYKYVQVNPILDWSEEDVLNFLQLNGLMLNNLYYKGYRSIDCHPCTLPVKEGGTERSGRIKDNALSTLRNMGYY